MQRFPVTLYAHTEFVSAQPGKTLHLAELTTDEVEQLRKDENRALLLTPTGMELQGLLAREPQETSPGYFDVVFEG